MALATARECSAREFRRRRQAAAWIAVATTTLAGCATDPPPSGDEIRSQADLGQMGLEEPWSMPAVEGSVQDNWLASFGDERLNALVAEAQGKNPDMRAMAARVEMAGQYLALAQAALLPAVKLLGTGGFNMGGGDITSALQGISLGVSWEPDLWGRIRYGRNAAQEDAASIRADFEFARQSLAAAVAKAWFTASETWLQLQIATDMAEAARELVRLAEDRRRVGPGSGQDVALALANHATAEEIAREVRLAHGQSLRALELLLGRYPSTEIEANHDLPALPGPVPAGLPLRMLERRPDMVAAERRVAAAFDRVGEAKAARLPRIILSANIAALQSDILQLQDDFENPVGGVGGTLIAPLFTGGELEAKVEIRKLEQKEAVADYARLALRALGDVEAALAAGASLADRERLLEQAVAENRRSLELVRVQYRVGQVDLRAVQQQALAVYSASVSLLRNRSEQLAQRVNLHLALGGSFEQPAPAPPEATAAAPG